MISKIEFHGEEVSSSPVSKLALIGIFLIPGAKKKSTWLPKRKHALNVRNWAVMGQSYQSISTPKSQMQLQSKSNPHDSALNACYFPCNAAFIKAQISREWEDYCAVGSAFETYWNNCQCCVQETTGDGYEAYGYLARDFAGALQICEGDKPVAPGALHDLSPCRFTSSIPISPIPTAFPTYTKWIIRAERDSLSVSVVTTFSLRQLRESVSVITSASTTGKGTLDDSLLPVNSTVASSLGIPTASAFTTINESPRQSDLTTASKASSDTFSATKTNTQNSMVLSKPQNIAAIIGGSIAGIVVLFLMVNLGIFLLFRQRQKRQKSMDSEASMAKRSTSPCRKVELPAETAMPGELDGRQVQGPFELDGAQVNAVVESESEERRRDGDDHHM
ncbi:hypothetical protein BX600DRAFT_4114 [Xylariales sp. PMI_506]|nr:hypothetical protein BX600DRAFT_4114 [Xylariales sp. PMI_506]